jgi:hypothetical protein
VVDVEDDAVGAVELDAALENAADDATAAGAAPSEQAVVVSAATISATAARFIDRADH